MGLGFDPRDKLFFEEFEEKKYIYFSRSFANSLFIRKFGILCTTLGLGQKQTVFSTYLKNIFFPRKFQKQYFFQKRSQLSPSYRTLTTHPLRIK